LKETKLIPAGSNQAQTGIRVELGNIKQQLQRAQALAAYWNLEHEFNEELLDFLLEE
jgi:hypothetical protein